MFTRAPSWLSRLGFGASRSTSAQVVDRTCGWRAWEWAQTALLAANLAWTTLCLGGYLARTMVVTSSLTAALLCVHALAGIPRRRGGQEAPPRGGAASAAGGRCSASARGAHPAGWLFLPFLAYAAANVRWVTPVPWLGWFDWLEWAQMIAVFWVVLNGIRSRAPQRALWAALFIVAVAGVLCASYQRFVRPDWLMLHRIQADQYLGRSSGPFGSPNSFAALLLLLLPPAGALALRRHASAAARVFFGWLALVLLFGLGLTISRGAWLGLAVALTAWPLLAGLVERRRAEAVPRRAGEAEVGVGANPAGPRGPRLRWGRRLLASMLVLAGIVIVGWAADAGSARVRGRLTQLVHDMGERSRPILWRAAWHMVREHPLTGTGGGSFDTEFERFRPAGFLNRPQWAHNDYLNTLSDYGTLGFVLFFGAAGLVIWRCARPRHRTDGSEPALAAAAYGPGADAGDPLADPFVRQAQAIGLLAFALQLFVDFHFKVPALAMSFATVAALAVQRAWPVPGDADTSVSRASGVRGLGRWAAPVALACAAAVLAAAIPAYRGEALRQAGREAIDSLIGVPVASPRFSRRIAHARALLDRAVALAPGNAQAWSDRAYAAAEAARADPSRARLLGAAAEADAGRAIMLAPLCAEYWIRRGVGRDLQAHWTTAGADFARAIALSPHASLPWFHYAYHLALRPSGRALAAAMLAVCLRLDPKNPDGLALRQHLATGRAGP